MNRTQLIAGALALFLASPAIAVNPISGSLDQTDPTWDGCGTDTDCFYDVYRANVDVDGSYTFTAEYAGDVTIDENLDGFLRLYANAFDPLNPATNEIAFDDDYSDTGGFPSCVGSNCSQIADVNLTAGTTYFMVQTSFTNAPTSFGQPTGPWQMTGSGPNGTGDVDFKPVPEPAAFLLIGSALFGLIAMRRRRR